MVRLREIERGRGFNLGGDGALTEAHEGFLEEGLRGARGRELCLRAGVDDGAVLRADVVSLSQTLGWVVFFPEAFQHRIVRELGRVEHDAHDLGVPGLARADVFVGRVGGEAPGISDRRAQHAVEAPEESLGAPEAAHADDSRLEPFERPFHRGPKDQMFVLWTNDGAPVGQRFVGGHGAYGFEGVHHEGSLPQGRRTSQHCDTDGSSLRDFGREEPGSSYSTLNESCSTSPNTSPVSSCSCHSPLAKPGVAGASSSTDRSTVSPARTQ